MDGTVVDLNSVLQRRRLHPIQLKVMLLCALIALLDGMDTQSFAIAAPAIARAFNMSVREFGPAFGIAHLGACLGAAVCGFLSDSVGRRRMLISATAVFGVFTLATAFSPNFQMLLLIRFCAGIGLGGALPCFLALSGEYAPPGRQGTLASLLWAAFPLGGMAGGFVNSYLVHQYGWPMIFYAGGVLPLVVVLVMLVGLPESPSFLAARDPHSPRLRKIVESITGQTFGPETRIVVPHREPSRAPIRQLFTGNKTAVTLLLWPAFFAAFGLLTLVVSWTPAMLDGAGIPVSSAAIALGFFNLGCVIGMGSVGWLVDRFGANRTVLPALLIATAFTWLFGRISSLTEAILVVTAIGLFLGAGASGLLAIASSFYAATVRSTGIGLGMAMGRLGQVLGPFVTGALMTAGLPIHQVMQLMLTLPLLAALAVFFVGLTRNAGQRSATVGGSQVG